MTTPFTTYTAPEGTVYLFIEPAKIDERARHEASRIVPQVRVSTGNEYDERKGVTRLRLKVRGREYTTDYVMGTHHKPGWKPDPADAHDVAWFSTTRGFHMAHKPYHGGHRHGATDQVLSSGTQADTALDRVLYDALAWLDAEHPEWRAESIRYAYERMIHTQETEIESAQDRIVKANARIAELTKIRAAVK